MTTTVTEFSPKTFPVGAEVRGLDGETGEVIAHRCNGLAVRWTIGTTGRREDHFYSFAELNAYARNGHVCFEIVE